MTCYVPLPRDFYARSAPEVARDCIGKRLVYERDEALLVGRIVETEAYAGVEDRACHGYGGHRSARNESMYGDPGHAYVFLIYGLHLHLNFVTSIPGDSSAVLLRALEPEIGEASMWSRRKNIKQRKLLTNGPGKLCQAFGIERCHDGIDLCRGPIYLTAGEKIPRIVQGERIGVEYAEDWAKKPFRFLDSGSPYVSVPLPLDKAHRRVRPNGKNRRP